MMDLTKVFEFPEVYEMKRVFPKEPPTLYGFMNYCCEKCGEIFTMELEIGVEDCGEHGRKHQPCPYVIRHDGCGGFAHDCSGLIRYYGLCKARPGTKYFAYDDSGSKDAYGHPMIYGYKAELPDD